MDNLVLMWITFLGVDLKTQQQKGKKFEREIADDLSKTFNAKIRRTPCSGGIHDFNTADIFCIKKDSFLHDFHFELKHRKSLNVHKTLWETDEKCPGHKIPIVIFKKNFDVDPIVTMKYSDFKWILSVMKEKYDGIGRQEP